MKALSRRRPAKVHADHTAKGSGGEDGGGCGFAARLAAILLAALSIFTVYFLVLNSRVVDPPPVLNPSTGSAFRRTEGNGAVASNNARAAAVVLGDDEDIRIVFSTGCNAYQYWQGETVLNSMMRVGQRAGQKKNLVGENLLLK